MSAWRMEVATHAHPAIHYNCAPHAGRTGFSFERKHWCRWQTARRADPRKSFELMAIAASEAPCRGLSERKTISSRKLGGAEGQSANAAARYAGRTHNFAPQNVSVDRIPNSAAPTARANGPYRPEAEVAAWLRAYCFSHTPSVAPVTGSLRNPAPQGSAEKRKTPPI
jgi:hypothetical protein